MNKPTDGPALSDLAHDWCQAKQVSSRSSTGNSDRARRGDLARWGRTISLVKGRGVDERGKLDLDIDLGDLTAVDLSVENVLTATEALKSSYKASTLQRLLSNMRAFCRWLVATAQLASSPFDSELLTIRASTEPQVRAFTTDAVQSMIDAAGSPADPVRSAWAARDVALVDLLAFTGVRRSECVALQIGDIAGADRPVLLIRRGTKSGHRREVPLPGNTSERLESYLAERGEAGLKVGPRAPLFVKRSGEALTPPNVYYLIRRIARAAAVTLPDDALVHGFRHHFGLQLALRGVPTATLQQLMGHSDPRTTAIYTRHASFDLINVLDEAGWL